MKMFSFFFRMKCLLIIFNIKSKKYINQTEFPKIILKFSFRNEYKFPEKQNIITNPTQNSTPQHQKKKKNKTRTHRRLHLPSGDRAKNAQIQKIDDITSTQMHRARTKHDNKRPKPRKTTGFNDPRLHRPGVQWRARTARPPLLYATDANVLALKCTHIHEGLACEYTAYAGVWVWCCAGAARAGMARRLLVQWRRV